MTEFIIGAVIREGLASIVREMRRTMVRSSYSSIIYEGYDFSCALIDAQGQLVAQSGEDHPFHVIPVAASVSRLLARHPTIDEDDLFLHNDPYTGGTHLNDVAVIWPVFEAGRLIFFIVIRSHWADIGGMTAGSLSGAAREILHEGLRLDNIRVDKQARSEALRVVFDNVRVNQTALADFHAVLGICRVAERRLRALLAKYTADVVRAAVRDVLDASERRMRASIAGLPSGAYGYVAYLDGNSAERFPLRVQVQLTISAEGIRADFSGTSAQVEAPLNAGPAIGPTSVLTILKSFLDPAGVINSGTLRPLDVHAPEGSIINARYPAPCGGLNEVRFAADAAVMGALAQVIPERIAGDVRGTSNHTYIAGTDARRTRPFIFYEYPSGGTGAWRANDGNHAVRAFNEGENVSIQSTEVVEATYPLRIVQNEIRPDSGGPGTRRGGCGLVRKVEILTETARLSVLSDRNLIPPFGVNGGAPGAANQYRVLRDGRIVNPSTFPGKVANFELRSGDVVYMASSGGGGYGPPSARAIDQIEADLADGFVSEAGLASYGCRRRADGAVERVGRVFDEVEIRVGWLPADGEPHLCDVDADFARRLDLRRGQLLELIVAHGPGLRLWIREIRADLAADLLAPRALASLLPILPKALRILKTGNPSLEWGA